MEKQFSLSASSPQGEKPHVEKNAEAPLHKRKPNRPGFNSYLKVLLDDCTMDRLHSIAGKVQEKVQGLQNERKIDESTSDPNLSDIAGDKSQEKQETNAKRDEEQAQRKATRKQQPLKFKARSRASLHMTFFFGGEVLTALPAAELIDWHGKVRDRLEESGFCLASTETSGQEGADEVGTNQSTADDNFWFDVTEICMFPPRRNNLIVAVLEASPAWHQLHKDVRDIAKEGESKALKDLTTYSKDKWTAHITLGNIFGGGSKGEVRNVFTKLLDDISDELIHDQQSHVDQAHSVPVSSGDGAKETGSRKRGKTKVVLFKGSTQGIAMGGPVPEQVKLDWNFTYCPAYKGTRAKEEEKYQ
jgi:2'-5' RNA ligase